MQDLQEADNWTSIDSPIQLDTGYEKEKEKLSQPDWIDCSNTDKSSQLLEALFPIQNENRAGEFTQFMNPSENKDNLIWVEFDIENSQDELKFFQNLDQWMVESHIHFKLNGRIHK